MAPHSFKPGVATPLKQNAFSKTDHHFTCWNTKADGSGKTYSRGQLIDPSDVIDGILTLYAQWSFAGVIVIATNENAEPSSQQFLQVSDDDPYGNGVTYYAMQFRSMEIDGKAPAYFCVEGINYKEVSVLLANYGIVSNGNGTYRSNDLPYDLMLLEPGVYISADESLRVNWIKILCEEGATVHLDLVYSENLVSVTYHSNYGVDETIETANSSEGIFVFLPADTFERDGYTFIGWSDEEQLIPDAYAGYMHPWGSASFLDTGSTIGVTDLYATWEAD